ncbi:MAG: hypothetical protein AAFO29_18685, partial [Actinomycetota bacterium]
GRCGQTTNATLHEGYLSDVDFDRWLQAADAVVLPYREIWSSGVVERAKLFDVQIVASDLPQLRGQAPPGTLFVSDVDELSVVMDKLRSAADQPVGHHEPEQGSGAEPSAERSPDPGPGSAAAPWDVDAVDPDRQAIQRQVSERARAAAMSGARTATTAGDRRAIDALLALGPLQRPEPISARPGVAPVKRTIGRLIGWRTDPLADRLDDLQRATTEAVARLEARNDHDGGRP